MKRFEIWSAVFPAARGANEEEKRCPVVIVSDDEIISELPFLSVVPVTEDLTARQLPSHVLLWGRDLTRPGRALCEQVTTLDKSCLHYRIGYVEDPYDRFAINRALAVYLNLTSITYIQEEVLYDVFGHF